MHKGFDSRLDRAWWALRIGLGVGPFLTGLDKYFNLLTNWPAYISPLALKILPFRGPTFMHIVGVIEMVVGLAPEGDERHSNTGHWTGPLSGITRRSREGYSEVRHSSSRASSSQGPS